jgi:hypothetical protein
MQQPIRKTVGKPLTPSQQLAASEEFAKLIQKHAHGTSILPEGDYFPVRKVVGRTRGAGS